MRTIAEATKQAVSGEDETLWQECMDRVKDDIPRRTMMLVETDYMRRNEFELVIKEMSSEQRKLYSIGEE